MEHSLKKKMQLRSNWISPNNDGYNDQIILDYELPVSNYILSVYLLDYRGRNYGKLLEEYSLNQKGTIIIPMDHNLQNGIYIL